MHRTAASLRYQARRLGLHQLNFTVRPPTFPRFAPQISVVAALFYLSLICASRVRSLGYSCSSSACHTSATYGTSPLSMYHTLIAPLYLNHFYCKSWNVFWTILVRTMCQTSILLDITMYLLRFPFTVVALIFMLVASPTSPLQVLLRSFLKGLNSRAHPVVGTARFPCLVPHRHLCSAFSQSLERLSALYQCCAGRRPWVTVTDCKS
jgi:hypothetical protein